MAKVFLSVPMGDRPFKAINTDFTEMEDNLVPLVSGDIETVTNYYSDEDLEKVEDNKIAWCLAQAASKIAKCDYVAFHPNYKESLGCKIEMAIVKRAKMNYIVFGEDFKSATIHVNKKG